jgi:signal transduction histidine kinase
VLKPFQERELLAVIEMALHRHHSEQRRTAHARIEQFLSDAGARLAATLDLKAIARDALELIVPEYADVCAIHLSDGGEPISEIARAEGVNGQASPAAIRDIVERAEETRHPQMLELPNPAEAGTDGSAGPMIAVCVPLVTRGEVLGAFAAGFREGRAQTEGHDLSFIEDFAHRLGVAVDNALLYRTSQRALTLRDNVLAVVSHDLRAPLSAIVLHAEMLADQPEARHGAQAIMHSAQLMTRIVGDLLDASAINAGHLTLDLETYALEDIVNDAMLMFEGKAEAKGIQLTASLDYPGKVRCDRDRVLQVLANLLSNAIKATPKGGSIALRVEVADTGTGIPEDEVAQLFDRFWQAKGNRGGAGLGLYIARGIVTAHGGSLGVATAVGEGSRFFFHLPESP